MSGIVPDESRRLAETVFEGAEIALFDGDQQVTPWRPYNLNRNVGCRAPRTLHAASVKIRSLGAWVQFPAQTVLYDGDTLTPPPPSEWLKGDAP